MTFNPSIRHSFVAYSRSAKELLTKHYCTVRIVPLAGIIMLISSSLLAFPSPSHMYCSWMSLGVSSLGGLQTPENGGSLRDLTLKLRY